MPYKKSKHAQGIIHNGFAESHSDVLDTGAQKSMIIIRGWQIIKRHGSWIDAQGVNMGGPSKVGRR